MSDDTGTGTPPPADPMAAEDGYYHGIVSEIKAKRRAGASLMEACCETAFYRVALSQANPAPDPDRAGS